jgi:hypothetical protein
MNWGAVGAVAEITASLAVIISLIYLGLQIRNQNVEARLASGNELASQLNNVYANLSENRELAILFLKGLRDFESLDEPETVQFSSYLNRLLRVMEAMFHQYQRHRLDATVWSGLNEALRDICRYPGMKSWLATNSSCT